MGNRRKLLIGLGAMSVTPRTLFAQAKKEPAKIHRIGVLVPSTASAVAHNQDAFTQGLKELGYVEGTSVVVERRFADGKVERLSALAAELVRIKVDVIVAATDAGIAAA